MNELYWGVGTTTATTAWPISIS